MSKTQPTQPIDTTSNKYSHQHHHLNDTHHNDTHHNDTHHNERLLTLNDAPPLTRFILNCQASKNNTTKIIYTLNSILTFVPFNYIVLGTFILNSNTIGIVLAIYGLYSFG